VTKSKLGGNRMIQVNLLFWTNDIAAASGGLVPKHAWSSGIVRLERNSAHGIGAGQEVFFHSLMDITAQIERLLLSNGIMLHPGRKMSKYVSTKADDAKSGKRRRPSRV
jgi:hypothetical protein